MRRSRGRGHQRSRGDGWDGWGGYMQAKRQKLQEQYKGEEVASQIFKGVSIYVNGYTKPSSDELKRLIILHGGQYEHYLFKTRVTHVIATNLPDSKVKEFQEKKVVKPEWITDSVNAGRLLSYIPYKLFTDRSQLQQSLGVFSISGDTSIAYSSSCISQESDDLQKADHKSLSDDKHENTISETAFPSTRNLTKSSLTSVSLSPSKSANPLNHTMTGYSMGRAGDPQFLNEFYSNSRLHHLSTWKSEFREYVNQLQKKGGDFIGRMRLQQKVESSGGSSEKQTGKLKRCIMHIDMDCFFVSVGLRNRPDLKGKPVAVTHSKGRGAPANTPGSDLDFEKKQWELKQQRGGKKGPQKEDHLLEHDFPDLSESESEEEEPPSKIVVLDTQEKFHSMAEIASCSYEARQAGVRNGMFMGKARQLCPDLVTIPYDFEGYQIVSKLLYDTVASYTHDIEAVSCDEMLVDCTDLLAATGATPEEFASMLRQEIYDKTGCTASAGLAPNILLAKMATKKAKPNGQFYLTSEDVKDFIVSQSVKDIPGVGWSMMRKFEILNVVTCGDLQKTPLETLLKEFGPKTGKSLFHYCRGKDDRQVTVEHQRKSVSAEVNYGIRFHTDSEAVKFVQELAEEVQSRLRNIDMKGKTITLKLMVRRPDAPRETAKFMGHGVCNNISKSVTLPMATDDAKVIGKECVAILRQQKAQAADFRGVGIQVHRLEPAVLGPPSQKGHQSILNFAVSTNPASVSKSSPVKQSSPGKFLTSGKQPPPGKVSSIGNDTKQCDFFKTSVIKTSTLNGNMSSPCNNSSPGKHLSPGKHSNQEGLIQVDKCTNVNSIVSNDKQMDTSTVGDIQTLKGRAVLKEIEEEPVLLIKNDESNEENELSDNFADDDSLAFIHPSGCIMEELARRKTAKKIIPPLPVLIDIPTPETPKSRTRNSSKDTIQADQSKDYFPSPSQLDLSCLNALPEDMQAEIRAAYAMQNSRQSSGNNKSPAKAHTNVSPKKKVSPSKRSSPSKGKYKSPTFKVPRGRPVSHGHIRRRGRPKKLEFTSTKPVVQKGFHTQQIEEQEPSCSPALGDSDKDVENISKHVTAELDISTSNSKKTCRSVNLHGAVTPAEVKSLIKEWLVSVSAPEKDDEAVMTDYLQELVLDKNLEQVEIVLKCLYRYIHVHKAAGWFSALRRILNHTQIVIQSFYGSTLKSMQQWQLECGNEEFPCHITYE
ncbi:hypothetical protein CHS0354_008176 [Potamilus streckersoni]|uniref:DNA repair protein REV1 n=1 Tax=Potamilus streckersoni TaxID=2493646 RepID=A0AAE0RWT3_9BIVA|nr:hypothetical protein CHS0354_008176 [Potamilus streckersoni]